MTDQWTDRLSEYLDGLLPPAERAALEAHLAGCAACAETLAELRRVLARARALDDQPPAADLWAGIAARIGLTPAAGAGVLDLEERRRSRWARRRFSLSVPQLAAASVALMVLSAGAAWLVRSRTPSTLATATTPVLAPAVMGRASWTTATTRYDAAVADLERALEQGRRGGRLDSTTVRILAENLRIIDRAILQAQAALAADPGNTYLNLHLAETMRRKLELLRQATAIASARS